MLGDDLISVFGYFTSRDIKRMKYLIMVDGK